MFFTLCGVVASVGSSWLLVDLGFPSGFCWLLVALVGFWWLLMAFGWLLLALHGFGWLLVALEIWLPVASGGLVAISLTTTITIIIIITVIVIVIIIIVIIATNNNDHHHHQVLSHLHRYRCLDTGIETQVRRYR